MENDESQRGVGIQPKRIGHLQNPRVRNRKAKLHQKPQRASSLPRLRFTPKTAVRLSNFLRRMWNNAIGQSGLEETHGVSCSRATHSRSRQVCPLKFMQLKISRTQRAQFCWGKTRPEMVQTPPRVSF